MSAARFDDIWLPKPRNAAAELSLIDF